MKQIHQYRRGLLLGAGAIVLASTVMAQLPPGMCPPMAAQMRGVRDEFSPANGNEPNVQSPEVQQFLQGKPVRGFDFAAGKPIPQNQIFGTSFWLGCCKVTKPVTITMLVRRNNTSQGANDKAYVHLGTPAGLGPAVLVEDLWKNAPHNTQTTRTVTFTLTPAQVNAHIFNNTQPFIDVLMQDDSAVDFVMLTN